MDLPQASALPSLHVAPASEYILSSYVPSHNKNSNGKNRVESTVPLILNYSEGQLAISHNWNGAHHALSIFGTEDTLAKDSKMMYDSIVRLRSFIKHHPVDKSLMERELVPIVKTLWKLFDTIYSAKWDTLIFNKKKNLTIRKYVRECIMPYYRQNQPSTSTSNITMTTTLSPLPSTEAAPSPTTNIPAAPPPPNKNVESTIKKDSKPSNMKKSYAQALKSSPLYIEDIVWVKEVFPALSANEIEKVLKIKNNGEDNKKPKINMTTRGLLRKEVIILMAKYTTELIVNSAHIHIANINKCLKNSRSDIVADFIRNTNNRIIITTNKLANNLNLSTIEKYLKSIQNINSDLIKSPQLLKFKSYMKIIELPYKIN